MPGQRVLTIRTPLINARDRTANQRAASQALTNTWDVAGAHWDGAGNKWDQAPVA